MKLFHTSNWIKVVRLLLVFSLVCVEEVFADNEDTFKEISSQQKVENTGGSTSRFDTYMMIRSAALVHKKPRKYSARLARVYPGAVLRVARTNKRKGCRSGWVERENGGFICSSHLRSTDGELPHSAPRDKAEILAEVSGYEIIKGGAKLYKRANHIDRGLVYKRLMKGSFLQVREKVTRFGVKYLRTREGWWVTAANSKKLPLPIHRLGIEVLDGNSFFGIMISEQTKVYDKPDGAVTSSLERWFVLDGEAPVETMGKWVELPIGGFVLNEDVALIRKQPVPASLKPGAKWIAIDLEEQMLHAYEGGLLVRVIPCSTGIRRNTARGDYRVQWKRRLQTMRLRRGRVRVEDVQYVMYYDQRNSIAIHSAYWNGDFGKPRSHGCVNLPRDDAAWLYQWSLPHSFAEDSENFQSRQVLGTRVIVF